METQRFYNVDQHNYYQGGFVDIGPFDQVPPNVVHVATAPPTPPEGSWVVLQGDGWVVTTTPPPDPPAPVTLVPAVISKMQASLALAHFGELEALETAIANSGSMVLKLYWRDVSEIHRTHNAVEVMRVAMGWTQEHIDAMFIFAKSIT